MPKGAEIAAQVLAGALQGVLRGKTIKRQRKREDAQEKRLEDVHQQTLKQIQKSIQADKARLAEIDRKRKVFETRGGVEGAASREDKAFQADLDADEALAKQRLGTLKHYENVLAETTRYHKAQETETTAARTERQGEATRQTRVKDDLALLKGLEQKQAAVESLGFPSIADEYQEVIDSFQLSTGFPDDQRARALALRDMKVNVLPGAPKYSPQVMAGQAARVEQRTEQEKTEAAEKRKTGLNEASTAFGIAQDMFREAEEGTKGDTSRTEAQRVLGGALSGFSQHATTPALQGVWNPEAKAKGAQPEEQPETWRQFKRGLYERYGPRWPKAIPMLGGRTAGGAGSSYLSEWLNDIEGPGPPEEILEALYQQQGEKIEGRVSELEKTGMSPEDARRSAEKEALIPQIAAEGMTDSMMFTLGGIGLAGSVRSGVAGLAGKGGIRGGIGKGLSKIVGQPTPGVPTTGIYGVKSPPSSPTPLLTGPRGPHEMSGPGYRPTTSTRSPATTRVWPKGPAPSTAKPALPAPPPRPLLTGPPGVPPTNVMPSGPPVQAPQVPWQSGPSIPLGQGSAMKLSPQEYQQLFGGSGLSQIDLLRILMGGP